jgi:hypothetical protein
MELMMKKCTTSFRIVLIILIATASGTAFIGFGKVQDMQKGKITSVIKSPSALGDVAFPHLFHFEDLEIECQTCHHETNASTLRMPHEDYFDDFWIDCTICHRSEGSVLSQPQACANCHHDSPTDIADETLSAKVVIHKNCWECHEFEKGENASRGCSKCHKKIQKTTKFYCLLAIFK